MSGKSRKQARPKSTKRTAMPTRSGDSGKRTRVTNDENQNTRKRKSRDERLLSLESISTQKPTKKSTPKAKKKTKHGQARRGSQNVTFAQTRASSEKSTTAISSTNSSEKLQKVLARAGFGSRREIEIWITEGRITVNGQQANLGDRVCTEDRIKLDGKPLSMRRLFSTRQRVIVYNKDFGSVCTRADPEQRRTIFEDLPRLKGGRWISIGRLDINTSGLLLLTTDGELANRLMHPSFEVEREYLVRVLGQVDAAILQRLRVGVQLEDGVARFEQIQEVGGEGANHWYRVILREGRKREVRRLWESQGIKVSRLTRIRFGNIEIPRRLARGHWQDLDEQALANLYHIAGLSADNPPTTHAATRKTSQPKRSQRAHKRAHSR